tara:strand:+ start:6425 stop:6625 length:201 start_codon:yes stop_codon:yes gene_type:complete
MNKQIQKYDKQIQKYKEELELVEEHRDKLNKMIIPLDIRAKDLYNLIDHCKQINHIIEKSKVNILL